MFTSYLFHRMSGCDIPTVVHMCDVMRDVIRQPKLLLQQLLHVPGVLRLLTFTCQLCGEPAVGLRPESVCDVIKHVWT